jgi:hypothetical protein
MNPDVTSQGSQELREVALVDVARVYSELIAGRSVIYLDTNVWIALAHARTDEARQCLSQCRDAQRARLAIFPVSYASISELIEQASSPSQISRCGLMDALSEGISFRQQDAIRLNEARNALRILLGLGPEPCDRTRVFSYVLEAFGDATVSFTAEWTDEMVANFIDYCWSSGAVTTLKWLLSRPDVGEWRHEHLESEQTDQSKFEDVLRRAINQHRTKDGKPHRGRALNEERQYYFRNMVVPLLSSIARADELKQAAPRIQQILAGHKELLDSVMLAMPTVDVASRLLAERIMNPSRPYKPEDFWDVEHAANAYVYSDAFCSLDGGLLHALHASGSTTRSSCELLGSLSDLREYLARASSSTGQHNSGRNSPTL